MEDKDRFVTREELLQELWDDSPFVDDNTLTVNVSRVKRQAGGTGCRRCGKDKKGYGLYAGFNCGRDESK